MAPQNSTLIHETVGSTSELSRYSPILPLQQEQPESNVDDERKSICSFETILQVCVVYTHTYTRVQHKTFT